MVSLNFNKLSAYLLVTVTSISVIFASLESTFGTWADTTMDEQVKVPALLIARGLEDVKERLVWNSMSVVMVTPDGIGAPGPEKVGTVTVNPVSTPVLLGVMVQLREKVVPS